MDYKFIDENYYYDGELGAVYSKEQTIFRLWAPTAKKVNLILEDEIYEMDRIKKGVWEYEVKGDLHGVLYNYEVSLNGDKNEVVDPYAKATTVNGVKGAVVDFERTHPDVWTKEKPEMNNLLETIIYELHIRDISIHKDSGIENKGKFLGLAELNTHTENGYSTGLSHIKELGITHVQLMPIFDFATVDETSDAGYNWGYDPLNFNSLDGSYSTDPYDPTARILEFKELVQTLHDEGLRIIMDVVYNHVWDIETSNFEKIFPGYYFRKDENGEFYNGSGCGNEVASERKMVRKFIIDSICFWAKEYNLDGFRFDLMGLIDIETMNQIRTALDKIDKNIIIIGEGWDIGQALPFEEKANYWNAKKMPRIGQFNDAFRDGMKGNVFDDRSKGFINGDYNKKIDVLRGIVGGVDYSNYINHWGETEPNQTINYIEVHDNHTLFDKLRLSSEVYEEKYFLRRQIFGTSILLLSQGIPFIHSGQEFMRTKYLEHNTYNLGDEINQVDWDRKETFIDLVNYTEELIDLRKKHKSFRMLTIEDIKNHMLFLSTDNDVIAYIIKDYEEEWKTILVIHNSSNERKTVKLPFIKQWKIVANNQIIDEEGIFEIETDEFVVNKVCTIVAYSNE